MSDKELLELAAKAAGITGEWCDCADCIAGILTLGVDGGVWNPLTDNDDALRLAVKLGMRLSTHCNYKMACASDIHMRTPAQVVPWGGDQESAVRQSIVLLAAAIGATP